MSSSVTWHLVAFSCIAAALGLLLLPDDALEPVRQQARDLAWPGQALTWHLRRTGEEGLEQVRLWWGRQSEIQRLQRELQIAQQTAIQLRIRLDEAHATEVTNSRAAARSAVASPSLFEPRFLPARILGQEIIELWKGRKLLAPDAAVDVQESLLVVTDGHPLIDVGRDHHLEQGELVTAQRIVLGRLAAVGHWTSALQPVTDEEFRAEAQIVRKTATGWQPGEIGLLSGAGQTCRLQLSRETPVSVGDEVRTRADDPWLTEPLLYGRVTEVRLPPGSLDWEITVEPAAADLSPQTVQILRYDLNPLRQLAN